MGDDEDIEYTQRERTDAEPYESIWSYYADEMKLLDVQLSALHAKRTEEAPDAQTDAFRGMYISEEEFIRLVESEERDGREDDPALLRWRREASLLRKRISERLAASRRARLFLPLPYVSSVFELTPLEENIVLLALAVELDRKYERIFGFLQDELTAKQPLVGLAVQLFARRAADLAAVRQALEPDRTLFRFILSRDSEETTGRSLLARPLSLDRRITAFLLGAVAPDPRIAHQIRLFAPEDEPDPLLVQETMQERLLAVLRQVDRLETTGILLWGNPGAGKKLQLRHSARELGRRLIVADVKSLIGDHNGFGERLDAVIREALLQKALLAFSAAEALFPEAEEHNAQQLERQRLFRRRLSAYPGIVFALSERRIPLASALPERLWHEGELAVPDERERLELWRRYGGQSGLATDWGALAGKFRFTPGQIKDALARADGGAVWSGRAPAELLNQACYGLVQHRLERRASRIEPRYGWDDIVLPHEQKELLREACNQIKFRSRVFGEWGFGRKLAYGKGLSMLFAGPPGTGKTMSAQVVARELELEMYKIDLSQVISKYIGETEQNLHELFREAQLSHAVLFFDETDALFGKRSEVKDAQDKYANIETAYLLQKMEEYPGITILATNLLGNMDEAFLRRIQFIIKFPFPDADYRKQLWRAMFPAETPLAAELDFELLAERHEIAGGNIKNIAVSAAFLAAAEGEPVRMRHIARALRHELQKSGKIVPKLEFSDY